MCYRCMPSILYYGPCGWQSLVAKNGDIFGRWWKRIFFVTNIAGDQHHRSNRLLTLNSYVWKSEWTHFDQIYACSIISITPLGPFFVDSRPDWIFDFLKYLNSDSKLHFLPNFDQFWHISWCFCFLGYFYRLLIRQKTTKLIETQVQFHSNTRILFMFSLVEYHI